jgi:hypothetical protein
MAASSDYNWDKLLPDVQVKGMNGLNTAYAAFVANPSWTQPGMTSTQLDTLLANLNVWIHYFNPAITFTSLGTAFVQLAVPYEVIQWIYYGQVGAVSPTPLPTPTPAPPSTTWPWPLDAVQGWFNEFWNDIEAWVAAVAGQVYSIIKPYFDSVYSWISTAVSDIVSQIDTLITPILDWIQGVIAPILAGVEAAILPVWDWIDAAVSSITDIVSLAIGNIWTSLSSAFDALSSNISAYFSELTSSIAGFAADIGARVSAINDWFSNEFIDPFLDWLVQFPGKIADTVVTFFKGQWNLIWEYWSTDNKWMYLAGGMIIAALGGGLLLAAPAIGAALIAALHWLGVTLLALWPAIAGFLTDLTLNIAVWVATFSPALADWLLAALPAIGTWFMSSLLPLIGSGAVLTLAATGALAPIVHNLITPAMDSIFNWIASRGQATPVSGADVSGGIAQIAEFTVTGLAAMTLAGEMLSPLKQLGLGNIAAMIYDLIDYKSLTTAFMGVLAYTYIKTPLTYYYNKLARPNKPDERALGTMAMQYIISSDEYRAGMQWYGYQDKVIDEMYGTVHRQPTPYMLRSLAEAGLLEDDLLDYVLHQSGYDAKTIPLITQMMHNLAATSQAALSTSTAMSRFREGFDNEDALMQNLTALGVSDKMLSRYVFAAQLQYQFDYQSDLKTFYIDAYHRRDIEEDELRTNLTTAGFNPERLDLVVSAQKIKRLAAPKAASDPTLTLQEETIRARRKKNLITRAEEIGALVAIGQEISFATAIADNDDVALTPAGATTVKAAELKYQTDAGKVEVDSARRLRRQNQISELDEFNELVSLEMPKDLAQAIVDNDTLRIKTGTAST